MEPRRGLGFEGFVLAVVLVLGMAASGIIPFRQVIAYERSVDLAREQRDALIIENVRLAQQVAALETPGEVERLAREQFGLVMPGETALVAVAVPDHGPPVAAPLPEFAERTPWWRALWNFVTGRDLISDE